MSEKFGWCFIGTGSIARRVSKDLGFTRGGAYIASVYSRNEGSARAFAAQVGATACDTLEAAVLDPRVRAVYIATPNNAHYTQTVQALALGKPVLCEKPFAINARQAQAMVDEAASRGLYLMEGMWTRFNPAIARALDWIAQGHIGRVIGVEAVFASHAAPGGAPERLYSPAYGGGGLLDLGVYTLAMAQFVLGMPARIQAAADFAPTGVDTQCAITLQYEGGAIARLYTSLAADAGHTARVFGEEGVIEIPAFALPDRACLRRYDGTEEGFEANKQGEGFQFEFDAVMDDIRAGRRENALVTHQYTMDVMRAMDAVRERIGLRFEADDK